MVKAREALSGDGRWEPLREELIAVAAEVYASSDDNTAIPAEYLVVAGRKSDWFGARSRPPPCRPAGIRRYPGEPCTDLANAAAAATHDTRTYGETRWQEQFGVVRSALDC